MADPSSERDPFEMLAAEYMESLRQGQRPSIEEYAARHPELAEEIRELFPTIAATEQLKARQAQSSGGRATLGAAQLTRLGDFRLLREIGRGGMGVVFEAEQESLGRRVAVKVLPRQILLDEKHLKRFQREARIAAKLHHTNIVEVFGIGEQEGFHYYVMQYIPGVGLDAVIRRLALTLEIPANPSPAPPEPATTPYNPEAEIAAAAVGQLMGPNQPDSGQPSLDYWRNVAQIGLRAAGALSYAHSQGVLHRDIKPANLLLDAQGMVWLADFGLAKVERSEELSLTQEIVGTLRYMAPEQLQGKADHQSDIYSLGLALYELLALRPAYEEEGHTRLIQRIAQGPPAPPSSARTGIPRDLETIILKATRHDARQRYASAGAMADDLRNFLEDRPIHARRATTAERLGRWCRRNPALASLGGTSLILLVLVALVASVGYLRTQRALRGEAQERARAEASAKLALEALDRTFERLYPARLSVRSRPMLEGLRGETIEVPSAPILTKEAASLLEEMLPFYDKLAQQTGNSVDLRLRTAEASRRVGAIRQRLGQTEAAVQAYQRAIGLYRELGKQLPPQAYLALAQMENELGRLFTANHQSAAALQVHLAALSLLQTNALLPSAPSAAPYELARTYFFLGLRERPLPATSRLEKERPDPIPAAQRDNLAKAVALLKSLPAATSTRPEYQHLLALCYLEGATVEGVREPAGEEGDERAIQILHDLAKNFPDIPDYAYDLSEAYARIHLPPPPIRPEDQRDIEERLNQARALIENLVRQHPDVPEFLASQARIHHKLGAFQRQIERWPEAETCFRQAVAVQSRLVKQFPTPYYNLWMATFRIALADAMDRCGQVDAARAELESTIATLSRELQRSPELGGLQDLLAMAKQQLEKTQRQTGQQAPEDDPARQTIRERNPGRR